MWLFIHNNLILFTGFVFMADLTSVKDHTGIFNEVFFGYLRNKKSFTTMYLEIYYYGNYFF